MLAVNPLLSRQQLIEVVYRQCRLLGAVDMQSGLQARHHNPHVRASTSFEIDIGLVLWPCGERNRKVS